MTTRIGLAREAIEVTDETNLLDLVRARWSENERLDYLICDEACFYTEAQVEQMADLVDIHDVDVFAFGLSTDFRSQLFPASRRAVRTGRRGGSAAGRGALLVRPGGSTQRPGGRRCRRPAR